MNKPLTERERQLLGYLSKSYSNSQIARALGLSQHTVHNYLAALYVKLGAHNRTQAVVYAIQRGLLVITEEVQA